MKVLIREDQYNRIYSEFKEKLHILFESTQGVLFSDEELKKIKPKNVIITQDIADLLVRHNKIKPTKQRKSTKPTKQTLPLDVETNYIDFLCNENPDTNLPYCKLAEESKNFQPEEITSLNKSIDSLFKVFKSKPSGPIPRIIKLALLENTSIVQFLKKISEFINNEIHNGNTKKTRLEKLSNKYSNITIEDLDNILNSVSNNYEDSFVGKGKVFDKKNTSLKLEYNCDKNGLTFFNLVKQIKNDKVGEEEIINNITKCIGETIDNTPPIKADVKTNVPLVLSGGSEIFSAGTYFEVKDFQYYTDSHLSEFFSIFKQSKLKVEKPEHINIYNNVISGIYKSFNDKKYLDFLDNIKKNIGGIILADNLIVKIEDIDLYWSFLGQRKNENRLSIRYQVKPGNIIAYKCDPYSQVLSAETITQSTINKVGVITED